MSVKHIILAAAAGLTLTSYAETVIKAVPVKSGEIKLDGVLAENVWQNASRYSNFCKLANQDVQAAEQTVFQVAASPDGVYFAFDIADKAVVAKLTRHDSDITKFDDVIELFISADDPIPSDANVRTFRQFIFNFAGTRAEGAFLAGVRNGLWYSDWQAVVKPNSKGVTAEVFIPYYALDFTNAQNRNLRFNVGRENITPNSPKEISTWQKTGSFTDMSKFALLEMPYKEFEQYQWQLNDLDLKNVPTDKGTVQTLSGKLTGKINDAVTIQATARSNGKVVAFNRSKVQLKSNQTVNFTMPLEVGKSGKYNITITGRNNGKKLFHELADLEIQATCFTLNVKYPIYRKSFYPDQKDKTLRVTCEYAAAPKLMKNVKTVFTVTDASGKVMNTQTGKAGLVKNFTVDTTGYPAGDYTVTITSDGEEFAKGTLSDTFSIIAPAKPGASSVRLDENRHMLVNGKPFFPRGFIGGQHKEPHYFAEMAAAGYNTVQFYGLNWPSLEDIKVVLDKAHKNNLKVFCYPYWGTSIGFTGFRDLKKSNKFRKPRMTDAQWERMKKMVNMAKDHPALLGWYLADEPRGAELVGELKKVYTLLKKLDPHHPVITLDFTAAGCISKKDGMADVHILDMYPHPFNDGTWYRSLPSVFSSMKMVDENIGNAGAWFCPEAFTPRGKRNRSLTYRELRCLVFGTIVNGATGMMPYKIGSTTQKYYIHSRNSGIFYTPDMRLGYLEGLGPELKALDGVLTSPEKLPAAADNSANIMVMRKKYHNKEYIFAVNSSGKTIKSIITAPGLKAQELKVVSEGRTVKVANSAFSDEFAPHATHIYTDDLEFKSPINIYDLEAKIKKIDAEAKANLKK